MKLNKFLLLMLAVLLVGNVIAENGEWLNDFEIAQKTADESEKYVLVNFSGSNWCYWCKKLSKEVFEKQAFQAYADDNLVLMVADFPRPNNLPMNIQKQNNALAQEYGVRGFPTVYLLDSNGNLVGKTGYQEGGPENYVAHLKSMILKYEAQ